MQCSPMTCKRPSWRAVIHSDLYWELLAMLKKEDNELITRVGPGTPMGNLMREYWVPAMLSSELPQGAGDPVRVRLLSEQLIGFRDSNGQVGLLANNCPHRVASLF